MNVPLGAKWERREKRTPEGQDLDGSLPIAPWGNCVDGRDRGRYEGG